MITENTHRFCTPWGHPRADIRAIATTFAPHDSILGCPAGWTDERTDGQMLPNILSHCFAIDRNIYLKNNSIKIHHQKEILQTYSEQTDSQMVKIVIKKSTSLVPTECGVIIEHLRYMAKL